MSALRATNKYLFKYKYHLIFGVIFVSIANLFSIVPAQIVRSTFDLVKDTLDIYFLFDGFNNQKEIYSLFTSSVIIYSLIILGMAFLRGIFMFFMRQTIIVMSRLAEYDQKNEIFAHYQTLPLSFYRRNNTGDMMARISEDVSKVRMYFGPAIMYSLNLITMTLLVVPYMISINVNLTLWTLLPLPLLSLSIYYINNLIEVRSSEIQKSLSGLSTFVQEAFSGIRVIKAFAREDDSLENYTKLSEGYKKKSMDLVLIGSFFTPLVMALVGFSTVIVVYIGGLEAIKGNITPGNIAEFIMYVTMLTWPFTSLGWVSSIIQRAEVSQQRINEFLNEKTTLVSTDNIKKDIIGSISFEDVTFDYPETNIRALKNVSFRVNPGESLAILGTTGSGKSTLANLLCRMMDVTSGRILIDDIDIKAYDISYLRNQIGYVPQDVFLFSDSIKNNILFGQQNADFHEMELAAKNADLHNTILQLEDGYETKIGERGITLSGGQKQRLSIARAIIREPRILILDDCLSAIDTHTENTILNNLKEIMKNRTTLIVSHRISSAKLAQHIILIDNGQIIEWGTHDDIYKLNGKYKEMYDNQQSSSQE